MGGWVLDCFGGCLNPCITRLSQTHTTAPHTTTHKQDAALLQRLRDAGWLASAAHGRPRLVVLLRPPENEKGQEDTNLAALSAEMGVPIMSVEEVLAIGAKHAPHYRPPELQPHDLLTLVYTSGTTGHPKGVALSHGNILHQINHISLDDSDRRNPTAGDCLLGLLPCWHIFQRSAELFALTRGAAMVYSSVRTFKADLATYRPHFLIVVPRLLENGALVVVFLCVWFVGLFVGVGVYVCSMRSSTDRSTHHPNNPKKIRQCTRPSRTSSRPGPPRGGGWWRRSLRPACSTTRP